MRNGKTLEPDLLDLLHVAVGLICVMICLPFIVAGVVHRKLRAGANNYDPNTSVSP